jgi:hypothetical protein
MDISHIHISLIKVQILLLTIILSACSTIKKDGSGDQSFLTDEPCAAPCWYGIEPGKSTEEGVMKTLVKLPFIDPNSIKEYGTVWQGDDSAKSIMFNCIYPKITDCGEALVSGDKLRRLRLPNTYSLTFYSAVSKLGPPSYISYGVFPPAGDCVVSVDWPNHGVSISNISNKEGNLCQTLPKGQKVPPNTKVIDIFYFEKLNSDKPIKNRNNTLEWPGFE